MIAFYSWELSRGADLSSRNVKPCYDSFSNWAFLLFLSLYTFEAILRSHIGLLLQKLPLNNDHLSTTVTVFECQGWSLYTGLTVYIVEVIHFKAKTFWGWHLLLTLPPTAEADTFWGFWQIMRLTAVEVEYLLRLISFEADTLWANYVRGWHISGPKYSEVYTIFRRCLHLRLLTDSEVNSC